MTTASPSILPGTPLRWHAAGTDAHRRPALPFSWPAAGPLGARCLSTNLTEGLRDIAGPVPVTSLVSQLLFWGALAALALAAALLARWWWRRRQQRLRADPPPPPSDAITRAEEKG